MSVFSDSEFTILKPLTNSSKYVTIKIDVPHGYHMLPHYWSHLIPGSLQHRLPRSSGRAPLPSRRTRQVWVKAREDMRREEVQVECSGSMWNWICNEAIDSWWIVMNRLSKSWDVAAFGEWTDLWEENYTDVQVGTGTKLTHLETVTDRYRILLKSFGEAEFGTNRLAVTGSPGSWSSESGTTFNVSVRTCWTALELKTSLDFRLHDLWQHLTLQTIRWATEIWTANIFRAAGPWTQQTDVTWQSRDVKTSRRQDMSN